MMLKDTKTYRDRIGNKKYDVLNGNLPHDVCSCAGGNVTGGTVGGIWAKKRCQELFTGRVVRSQHPILTSIAHIYPMLLHW